MTGLGRVAWIAGGLVAGVLAVGALAHALALRPLLHWIGGLAGCPASLSAGDAQSLEQHRAREVRRRAGAQPAASRPALGFELGGTTRHDVDRQLAGRSARCEESNGGAVLRCEVRGAAGERLDAHLQFDPAERLVAVDAWHDAQPAHAATQRLKRLEQFLNDAVGPATGGVGEAEPAALAGKLSRVARRFEYSDYVARISAIRLGARGVRVREQYQWVPPRIRALGARAPGADRPRASARGWASRPRRRRERASSGAS